MKKLLRTKTPDTFRAQLGHSVPSPNSSLDDDPLKARQLLRLCTRIMSKMNVYERMSLLGMMQGYMMTSHPSVQEVKEELSRQNAMRGKRIFESNMIDHCVLSHFLEDIRDQ